MRSHLFTAMMLLVAGSISHADMQVESFEAGLFAPSSSTTGIGERLIGAKEDITATRQIPAKRGVKFGLRYTLGGKSPAGANQVKYLYLTPGVIEPDGSRHDKYEVIQTLSARAPYHVMAFEFTEDYEVIPGEWQMMVFAGDRLLLKESFAVGISEQTLSSPPAQQPKTLKSVIRAAD